MDGQGALFEGGPPEAVPREVEPSGPLVPRPEGWSLIANRAGPHGFHRIRAVGPLAVVVTLCGVTGRKISESERAIILCPVCEAASAR